MPHICLCTERLPEHQCFQQQSSADLSPPPMVLDFLHSMLVLTSSLALGPPAASARGRLVVLAQHRVPLQHLGA